MTYESSPPCRELCLHAQIEILKARFKVIVYIGWLRLVGSLKFKVSLVKEPYKGGYILQKRHIILRSLLIALECLYILHSAVSSILRISTYSSAMSPIRETIFCKRDL